MKEAIELLEQALKQAEDHPCFAGYGDGMTEEEIEQEGGDIAFVTLDIAWNIKKAIDILTPS